jgi:hypothetical protein
MASRGCRRVASQPVYRALTWAVIYVCICMDVMVFSSLAFVTYADILAIFTASLQSYGGNTAVKHLAAT